MAVVRRFSVAMAAVVDDVALKMCQAAFDCLRKKSISFTQEKQLKTNLRASSLLILLSGAEAVPSGGNIRDRIFVETPLLALLDKLTESFCLVIVMSDDVKLIPLSVYMLPNLLDLLRFDSGKDLDARIDDCVPFENNY